MGAGNQTGQDRTEAGVVESGLSDQLRSLWEEMVAVTRQMAEFDLAGDDAPRFLQYGQNRQIEIRKCIESLVADQELSSSHFYIQASMKWELQLQERLQEARQQYRDQYHHLKQGHRLRNAYNYTAIPDAYFVSKRR